MPAASTMPAPLRTAIDAELAGLTSGRTEVSARRLSARYLADRPADAPIVATDDDVAAYLTTRMPATFAAVSFALDQVRDVVPDLAPRTLLDLGSGTGAATWAAWDTFEDLERADLVDYSTPMLTAARRMLAASDLAVTTSLGDAGAASRRTAASPDAPGTEAGSTHDLAVAAFVLSELTTAQRTAVVERLTTAAAQCVLVVEPGTPAGYGRILTVRAELIAAGWRIVAPCPHEHVCPLAQGTGAGSDTTDWCHAAVRLERTAAHRRAKGGERSFEDEKLAYVAAVPPPRSSADDADPALDLPAARVLRHPQTRPGHIRLELCTSDGAHESTTVTKRDKDAFRAARKIEWGQAWRP
ncbi:small ribosomal subunit Rsm22 family protein [Serinibacter arcticus]|uniref:Methyltransferase n=1 Tax=Serinibacter arcticus TaxID=1655435 RepID=A0A4Z1E444_9MICO|nr:small ribosomal subunit Rsm22 family protein [Serinibacter arcticus]TGO06716.1 Methyltransferase [Serinibacter arcticus]